AISELVEFEDAYGAVPDDRSCGGKDIRELRGGLRADVENQFIIVDAVYRTNLAFRACREFPGYHYVDGYGDTGAIGIVFGQRTRLVQHLGLVKRLADGMPRGGDEGIGNPAADNQLVHDPGQRIEYRTLRRDLRPADDRYDRPCRILQSLAERFQFRSQERSGARNGCIARHAVSARLRPMGSAESIHDEHVAKRAHAPRKVFVAGFFTLEKTNVLEQDYLPRNRFDAVDPVLDQRHIPLQQFAQYVCHRLQ